MEVSSNTAVKQKAESECVEQFTRQRSRTTPVTLKFISNDVILRNQSNLFHQWEMGKLLMSRRQCLELFDM